jgi:hypothetical protein
MWFWIVLIISSLPTLCLSIFNIVTKGEFFFKPSPLAGEHCELLDFEASSYFYGNIVYQVLFLIVRPC